MAKVSLTKRSEAFTPHAALDKAVEENLIFRNPSHGYKFPFSKSRKIEILSAEEIQRLLIQAREDACYKLLLLELSTGLRRGKICALQWNDLNLKTGALQVERQVHWVKSELVISPPKTNAGKHTVLLPRPSVGGPILPHLQWKTRGPQCLPLHRRGM